MSWEDFAYSFSFYLLMQSKHGTEDLSVKGLTQQLTSDRLGIWTRSGHKGRTVFSSLY